MTKKLETHPCNFDDSTAVDAAAMAGRIRPQFMTPDQIERLRPALIETEAVTVAEAVKQLAHLPERNREWWQSIQAKTKLRVSEILEEIGDEVDHPDDPGAVDIAGIINRELGPR